MTSAMPCETGRAGVLRECATTHLCDAPLRRGFLLLASDTLVQCWTFDDVSANEAATIYSHLDECEVNEETAMAWYYAVTGRKLSKVTATDIN